MITVSQWEARILAGGRGVLILTVRDDVAVWAPRAGIILSSPKHFRSGHKHVIVQSRDGQLCPALPFVIMHGVWFRRVSGVRSYIILLNIRNALSATGTRYIQRFLRETFSLTASLSSKELMLWYVQQRSLMVDDELCTDIVTRKWHSHYQEYIIILETL